MKQDKKIRAAIFGVLHYMRTEEERKHIESNINIRILSPWQLNGRQTIMQMSNLMQRRLFKRL